MAFGDEEPVLTHRSRVLLVGLVYIVYAVLSIVGLSVVAAAPNQDNTRFGAVVALLVPSLHFATSTLGALMPSGRQALQVDPVLIVLLGDWMQAAALGAASVAVDIGGGLEGAKPSVIIACCAMNSGAQLACFYKAAFLLDGERFDQTTGESLQNL